jgi:glucosyl-dolichyl phosphate glucuronosyltransferase
MQSGAHITSVVICAYTPDRWASLARAVSSVQAQMPAPAEVIVVIDHHPALLARARNELTGCLVIENNRRRGLSGARNSGLAVAGGEIVAFIDDDAEADPGWLAALVAAFEDASVVGAGGTIASRWETGRPIWFPPAFDWVIGCTYDGYPTESTPVRNVLGCNMAFRRLELASVGGFRPELGRVAALPYGVEETEVCIRLAGTRRERSIWHMPAAVVQHAVPRDRATWSYFRRRCFGEGLSKAILSRMVGQPQALATERRYARSVLPRAVVSSVREAIGRREPGLIVRAAAILAGLVITAAGYGWGMASNRSSVAPGIPADA